MNEATAPSAFAHPHPHSHPHAHAHAHPVPPHYRLQSQHLDLGDPLDDGLVHGVQVSVDFGGLAPTYGGPPPGTFDSAGAHHAAAHGLPPQQAAAMPRRRVANGSGSTAANNSLPRSRPGARARQQQNQNQGQGQGQFGILTPTPLPVARLQAGAADNDDAFAAGSAGESVAGSGEGGGGSGGEGRPHGVLSGKIVVDPPRLAEWRQRLFNVDETIVLSHEDFETYFPHIDNVYSHRSTQRYKRKPFVGHYWDCRMKGRPPGTPKSDDPNKKKRKRQARERDLCDVKIKITEYFAGATLNMLDLGGAALPQTTFPGPGTNGERFWTIQRVNGNGGNGKGDGVAGPHKHSLDKSDEIKKNSVQRYLAAQEKETKKTQKVIQRKPNGAAAATVKKHMKDSDLKLYAACFCPFSQRVWIALEAKGLPYQYCETDPFKRPTQLLEANPQGLVPAIREGDWACGESAVILEYLEDRDSGVRLYPTEPRLKANCRLWIDHINSRVVPSFYYLLHAIDEEKRNDGIERLQRDIVTLVNGADERGPFFLGSELCLVDVHFAPFAIRLSRILTPFRNWTDAFPGIRWQQWVDAIERNSHVQATTSTRELYRDTFDSLLSSRQLHLDPGAS